MYYSILENMLLYGRDIWTIQKKLNKLHIFEMDFWRRPTRRSSVAKNRAGEEGHKEFNRSQKK